MEKHINYVSQFISLSFSPNDIKKALLRERAYNLRWAEVDKSVIPLTAADLDFPCAAPIIEAINKYVGSGYLNYGPPQGLLPIREAVASSMYKKRGLNIPANQILPVNSAAFGIYVACKAILSIGDEAIIFDPVDFLFRKAIESVGGKAIPFSIAPGAKDVDFSQLEALITKKTKMICLCNPLNPTGKVFTKKELLALANIAEKRGLIILSDEIWSDIVFEPNTFTSIASLDEEISNNTITITGFSKSYGLAGLRVGAVMTANSMLFKKIYDSSLHESTINGVSTISQIAATTAINDCQPWLEGFLQHLTKMRTLCMEEIQKTDGFSCVAPEGCYVAFINIRNTGMSAEELYFYLLNEARVAVVPGLNQWFGEGAECYIRISFATSENILKEAFHNIQNAMNKIKSNALFNHYS